MNRVFVAIEFEQHIKDYLDEIQKVVINASNSGNFTRKSNFHLTLKFIGEAETDVINKIKKCIDGIIIKNNNFELYLDKLGQFPRQNKSIVWIGLKPSKELNKLFSDLELELEKIDIIKDDRKFTPHITLARQVTLNNNFNNLAQKVEMNDLPIKVDKISLMESHRVNNELNYTPIYIKELSNTKTDFV